MSQQSLNNTPDCIRNSLEIEDLSLCKQFHIDQNYHLLRNTPQNTYNHQQIAIQNIYEIYGINVVKNALVQLNSQLFSIHNCEQQQSLQLKAIKKFNVSLINYMSQKHLINNTNQYDKINQDQQKQSFKLLLNNLHHERYHNQKQQQTYGLSWSQSMNSSHSISQNNNTLDHNNILTKTQQQPQSQEKEIQPTKFEQEKQINTTYTIIKSSLEQCFIHIKQLFRTTIAISHKLILLQSEFQCPLNSLQNLLVKYGTLRMKSTNVIEYCLNLNSYVKFCKQGLEEVWCKIL